MSEAAWRRGRAWYLSETCYPRYALRHVLESLSWKPCIKLKLGFAGDGSAGTGNYVESDSSVENYSEALLASNSALAILAEGTSERSLYK